MGLKEDNQNQFLDLDSRAKLVDCLFYCVI
jgi:hypothetical protein